MQQGNIDVKLVTGSTICRTQPHQQVSDGRLYITLISSGNDASDRETVDSWQKMGFTVTMAAAPRKIKQ
jgi:hypothetical protein